MASTSSITQVTNDVTRLVKEMRETTVIKDGEAYTMKQVMYQLKDGSWTDSFDPSQKDRYARETFIQTRAYEMQGLTGISSDGQLSIGQIVMALCLQRATEVENESIVPLMESLAENTTQINCLTIFTDYLSKCTDCSSGDSGFSACYSGIGFTQSDFDEFRKYFEQGWPDIYNSVSWQSNAIGTNMYDSFLIPVLGWDASYKGNGLITHSQVEEALSIANSKLDSLNSISQELLIELQSETNRRDQAYDLVSAVNKSFNNVLISTANNL